MLAWSCYLSIYPVKFSVFYSYFLLMPTCSRTLFRIVLHIQSNFSYLQGRYAWGQVNVGFTGHQRISHLSDYLHERYPLKPEPLHRDALERLAVQLPKKASWMWVQPSKRRGGLRYANFMRELNQLLKKKRKLWQKRFALSAAIFFTVPEHTKKFDCYFHCLEKFFWWSTLHIFLEILRVTSCSKFHSFNLDGYI